MSSSKRKWKRQHTSLNKTQSSHSSPPKNEGHPPAPPPPVGEKPCYRIARFLGSSLHKMLGWLWRRRADILLWASVVMTLAAGAFFFLPRVTVDPSGPYDPSNPSAVTFTVANINIVPLRDVQLGIGLCYIDPPPGAPQIRLRGAGAGEKTNPIECNGPTSTRFVMPIWRVAWLDPDEKYQIAMEDLLRLHEVKQAEKANITIVVTYSPWRMFWRSTKEFRFITKRRTTAKSIGFRRRLNDE
jgi:hypothetical protein